MEHICFEVQLCSEILIFNENSNFWYTDHPEKSALILQSAQNLKHARNACDPYTSHMRSQEERLPETSEQNELFSNDDSSFMGNNPQIGLLNYLLLNYFWPNAAMGAPSLLTNPFSLLNSVLLNLFSQGGHHPF